MAQTKRKRRTKHRGNAAGMVEVRGRTGRVPAGGGKPSSRMGRAATRYDRPPTWNSAMSRAGIATLLFIAAVTVLGIAPLPSALAIGGLMFLMYVPLGYFTDGYIYKRRQAKRAAEKA